jgi:ribosomal protein S18 acetylase RimI-like enzyme
MAGTLAPPRTRTAAIPIVQTLHAEDVPALRLPGRRSSDAMRDALELHSGRSVWIPETLEYALVGSWRNRPEIACIDELVAIRNVEPLLRSAFERCLERGDALLLAIELEAGRGTSRFQRAGMEELEEVITYEIDVARVPRMPQKRTRLVRIDPGDVASVDRVTALDQAAFPWLWRNSRTEFDIYLNTPGVEVAFIEAGGTPVAYIGTTIFAGWGHLDRIAVEPSLQRRGFGLVALTLAIDTLRRRGARRVGLSTQRTNLRSQQLYVRFGFHRTPELDYQLFGWWGRAGQCTALRTK